MGAMLPLCVDLDLSAQKDSDQMCICQAISNRGPRRVETKPLTPVSCRPSPSETDIQFPCQTEKPVPENYLTYSLLYSYRMPQANTPGTSEPSGVSIWKQSCGRLVSPAKSSPRTCHSRPVRRRPQTTLGTEARSASTSIPSYFPDCSRSLDTLSAWPSPTSRKRPPSASSSNDAGAAIRR